MEVPTYSSFTELLNNYEQDFQKWNNIFSDASEEDFRAEMKNKYSRYFYYDEDFGEQFSLCIDAKTKNEEFLDFYGFINEKSLVNIISNRITFLCNHLKIQLQHENFSDFLEKITDDLGSFENTYFDVYGFPNDKQFIEMKDILKIKNFLKLESNFLDDYEISFDDIKFRNFEFSVNKILQFLSNENEDLNELRAAKYSTPLKIKVLDQLNIKGWLFDKGFSTFQIEALLADLFDVSDRTIRNGFSNSKHEATANKILEEIKTLKAGR